MQRKVIVFILVVIIGLGAFALVQSRKAARFKVEAAAITEKVGTDAKTLESQQQTIERLQKQKSLLNRQLQEMTSKGVAAPALSENSDAQRALETDPEEKPKGGAAGFLSKMMEDPEMKKMVRAQQKQMVNLMYGSLFKELNLTADATEKLTALMLENQMNAMEKGSALFNQSGDRIALQKALADDKTQFEDGVKELLGEEGFAQYEEFNKTLPDRMTLNQLKTQFGDNPLSERQSSELLALMKEERQRVPTVEPPADFSNTWSEETTSKFFSQQEEINDRVIHRAATVLAPEQVEALGRSLTNNLALQRAGMNMARTMLGGAASNNPAPAK